MNLAQGSFVIVGANTKDMKVFWNGKEIENVEGLNVVNNDQTVNVVLTVKEDQEVKEMTEAGIRIKRV